MPDHYFEQCLYFTASRMTRSITRMAEEEFQTTGLSPTYAFLMLVVKEKQGISQKELGEKLHIAPSTITRFIEKLIHKGYVTSVSEGKRSLISMTPKGAELMVDIERCWRNLHNRFRDILGPEDGGQLTKLVYETCRKLEENR